MIGGGRVKGGGTPRSLENQERDAEAARMRGRGASYQKIADALGYGNRSNAHRAVARVMAETIAEPAEEARQFQLDQLDSMTEVAFEVLEANNFVVSDGRIVRDEDGAPIRDPEMVLKALDRLIKIQERRAKLLGIDAPKRSEVVTVDWLSAQVAELEKELSSDNGSGVRQPH